MSSAHPQPTRHETRKAHTEAFVLRAIPYGERDVMVTLLTRDHGRISAMAKNARSSRRFAGGLGPLRRAQVILDIKPGRELHLLLELELIQGYAHIERSYDKITIASYATELIRELAREEPDSGALVDLLAAFYQDLDAAQDDLTELACHLHHLELRLLERFGAQPSLYRCHRCGLEHTRIERLQCSRTGEGLLCSACKQPGEAVGTLDPQTLAALHRYDTLTPSPLPAHDELRLRQQAARVIQASFQQILSQDLKSKALLHTLWR